MSELERIIGKYLSKEETAITYSDFNQEEVNKLFQNMGIYPFIYKGLRAKIITRVQK